MTSRSRMTRRHPRQSIIEPVRIHSRLPSQSRGVLREISCSGALVISRKVFVPGEHLTMSLASGPEGTANAKLQLQGRVVRCERRAGDKRWRYATALEFDRVLSEEELAQLRRTPGKESIRCGKPFLAELGAHGSDGLAAMVQDLSETGAMLLTRSRLQVGERVLLTLSLPEEEAPADAAAAEQVIEARVARSELCGDGLPWRCAVGVRFDRPL
ncbi:MAG: PilZ domain-containing protein [Deltaproteobacteria bacterium]|nr:PilZ domain-containing protein [Deltaproteobacteria bacterium]